MRRISIIALAASLATVGFVTWHAPAAADKQSNLQVYPKDTPKKAIKKDMKVISKALGVKCNFCHNVRNMAEDTKYKEISRKMMRMTERLNKEELKSYGGKLTCNTCHRGKAHPAGK